MTPVLAVEGLGLRFGGVTALDGVSFTVDAGERLALVGPNGAGKTSVLNCISGVERPTSGRIVVNGRDLAGVRVSARAAMGVARTLQALGVIDDLTVLANLLLGRHHLMRAGVVLSALALPRARREEAAHRQQCVEVAAGLGLDADLGRRAGDLAPGARKRLELGRALAQEAGLLLLDEPFAGAGGDDVALMVAAIRAASDRGAAAVIVDHDLATLTELAHGTVALSRGPHGERHPVVTEFLQLLVKGLALGSVYTLVALGFVVVFRATGVINFAQGSLMLVGAYLTYAASAGWGLAFPLAIAVAAIGAVVVGLVVERVVVRPLAGQPVAAVVLATLGVAIVLDQLVTIVWGFHAHDVGDPWGVRSVRVGGLVLSQLDLVTLVVAGALVSGLSLFFQRTRLGLALRAASSDLEAAAAQGISPALVSRLAWVLAALVATAAGVLLASGPADATPELGLVALRAFPAVLLGGFASLGGALAGGLIVGVLEVMTAGYLPGRELVVPYVVMLAVLLIRPDGIFGTRDAVRL